MWVPEGKILRDQEPEAPTCTPECREVLLWVGVSLCPEEVDIR